MQTMSATRTAKAAPLKQVISVSTNTVITHALDDLASFIKSETGLQVDRSKLMNIFCEIGVAHQENLDLSQVNSYETLKQVCINSIRMPIMSGDV